MNTKKQTTAVRSRGVNRGTQMRNNMPIAVKRTVTIVSIGILLVLSGVMLTTVSDTVAANGADTRSTSGTPPVSKTSNAAVDELKRLGLFDPLMAAIGRRGIQSHSIEDEIAMATNATQQAYVKASNTQGGDVFGFAVSVSGDTVVVGARGEDSNATGVNSDQGNNSASSSGAVYVFTRLGNSWTQQAYLKPSNSGAEDQFGRSVAISGDTIVVGAFFEDSNATGVNGDQSNNSASNSGAAYVFTRSGTTWTQQAYLKASNTTVDDNFGLAVAVAGDTIAVGANGEDSNATGVNGDQGNNSVSNSGAVYVFTRSGTTWTQQAYLKASNTGATDQLGVSVAVLGDTLVACAFGEDSNATGVNGDQSNNSATNSGAAYVFTRSGTTWTQQAYLKASNTGAGDQFGRSVALSGDTVVIGADLESSAATGVNGDQGNNSAPFSGAAYVYTRSGTAWTQQAYLKASNTGVDDEFGFSVAVSGDTIVVGAYKEDSTSTGVNGDQANNLAIDSGAAYVFTRSGSIWSQNPYLKASNTGEADVFGFAVGVSGNTLVAGAYGESSNATGVDGNQSNNSASLAGAAYVFALLGGSTPGVCVAPPPNMVAWLAGDGNANDITGSNNNGTLQNGASYTTGMVGQSFRLDGVNDHVQINSSGMLRGQTAATVDAWVRPLGPHSNSSRGAVFHESIGGASDLTRFGLFVLNDGRIRVGGRSNESGGIVTLIPTETIPLNQWSHITGTWSATEGIRAYINGQLVGSLNQAVGPFANTTSNFIAIGTDGPSQGSGSHFNGDIDEVEVFPRALSQTEILSIYNAGSAGKCKPGSSPATISGRVTTPGGLGLRNAVVSLIDPQGNRRLATTSSFGIYSFENVPLGSGYSITVSSKRYRFAPSTLAVSGNLSNIDFVGLE